MSLYLKDFLPRILKDLNRAWLVILGNTSKKGTCTVHSHKLRNVNTCLKSELFFAIFNLFDRFICAHSIESGLNIGLICHTREIDILKREFVLRISFFLLSILRVTLLGMKVPLANSAVPTARNETRIIIKPLDASDLTRVILKGIFWRAFCGIELMN